MTLIGMSKIRNPAPIAIESLNVLHPVAGEAGSGDAAIGSAAGEGASDGSGAVEEGFGREGIGGGFFARCLAQGRGATPAERKGWRAGVYDQIGEVMQVQGKELEEGKLEEGKPAAGLSVEKMCQVAVVSRAGYYRSYAEQCPEEEEMMVRSMIQKIVVEHRGRYGYRRVWFELNQKMGMVVNHKRVLRLMREDNLLALQRKQFVMTTDSKHSLEIALNLARHMKLTAVNQLWVADITYIGLSREFVFLAVVMDAYSRKVVDWDVSRSLSSGLVLRALKQAIAMRQPSPGLVHHSDRGAQYASREYVELLEKHQMVASMSRPGNPYDKARCERFMQTLKQEEINASAYRDLEHLRENLGDFIERYYNRKRLHSALGYRTPEEFERAQSPSQNQDQSLKVATVTLTFGRAYTLLGSGTGTQTPSPSPNPNPLLENSERVP
jgi:putative transposase